MNFLVPLLAACVVSAAPAEPTNLSEARGLLMGGKYGEAAVIFREADPSPGAALGLARCYTAEGKYDDACKVLAAEIARLNAGKADDPGRTPRNWARLHAEIARIEFERGNHAEAVKQAKKAVGLRPEQALANFILAEVDRTAGRIDEAEERYAEMIRHYNENTIEDAESLRWIGRAATRYSAWNRMHNQFKFLVSELYPDAIAADEHYWPAHLEAARLFLDKHNQADASRQIQAGLELNPNAAELHVAKAELAAAGRDFEQVAASIDRAIEINPKLVDARLAQADLALANFDTPGALKQLTEIVRPLNPVHEPTLGRIAACYLLIDGVAEKEAAQKDAPNGGKPNRFAKLVDEVTKRNPHAGEFYYALGSALESRHKHAPAKQYHEKSIEVMPKDVGARTSLGMIAMQTADNDDAKKWLDAAFRTDPFNVRVKNMLEVLDVLDEMKTHETDHVVIRYAGKRDELLVGYVAKQLDTLYPEMCKRYGYTPPRKPVLEIFSKAKGYNGHNWFSARLVGLPYVGTIAASTGRMVGMVSPNELQGPMQVNWARVVEHEFVHVVTLQQTDFNIPHWFTEGLAVLSEGGRRRPEWNAMLLSRVSKGKVFNLHNINFGFIRPKECDDRQMAYCQAEIYVEFMIARWGEEKPRELLEAYAEGMDTPEAISHVFGISAEKFDQDFRKHLDKLVADMPTMKQPSTAEFAELAAAHRKKPDDADAAAELAYAYLRRRAKTEAAETAQKALDVEPKHQLATYVVARLKLEAGETIEAAGLLQKALDHDAPQPNALNLLAGLKLKSEQYDEAAELYALGEKNDATNLKWTKSLAKAYLLADNEEKLAETLGRLAEFDIDQLNVRKKLAKMALEEQDYDAAARWAREAVEINVLDAAMHQAYGEALVGREQFETAIGEFEIAIELNSGEPYLRYALADACVQSDQPAKAQKVLEELLMLKPDYPGAELLLEEAKQALKEEKPGK